MGDIEITPGAVRVNYVRVIHDLGQVKIWEVDLHTKYAEVGCYRGGNEIGLMAGEDTIKTDPAYVREAFTWLKLPVPDDWVIIAHCARYTLMISAHSPRPTA